MKLRIACGSVFLSTILIVLSGVAVETNQETQASRRADGVIAGRVIDGTTGEPVEGVSVRLHAINADPIAAATERLVRQIDRSIPPPMPVARTTDQDGRFEFAGLPPGRYVGLAELEGFISGELGDRKGFAYDEAMPAVVLRPGERLENLVAKVWRGGSIRGVVTDERGEPIVKALVQSFRRQYVGGRPVWSRFRSARTDDRGAFQLADLWPATYLVALMADPAAGRERTLFYGGSQTADGAALIVMAPGDRREGIDMVHTFVRENQVASLSLSGHVIGDAAAPGRPVALHLVPDTAADSMAMVEELTAVSDPRGAFSFPKVPPGAYHVVVWQFPATETVPTFRPGMGEVSAVRIPDSTTLRFAEGQTMVASVPVLLERSVSDLVIALRPAARITGRVIFDGGQPPPGRLRWLPLLIHSAHGREYRGVGSPLPLLELVPVAEVEADGTFRSIGLPPGKYSVIAEPRMSEDPQLMKWGMASLQVAGREMAGAAIDLGVTDLTDVTVTTAPPSQLSGVIRDAKRQVVPYARVIIFPRDRERWADYLDFFLARRLYRATADREGAFEVRTFPGEYLVAAVSNPPEFWMAPEYLETLVPSAVSVVVPRAGTARADVTLK